MAEKHDLSTTDASNTQRFPEGMAPSAVNNGARALEGLIARYHFDTNFSVVATISASLITITANRSSLTLTATTSNYISDMLMAFTMGANPNTGPVRVTINTIGAISLRDRNGTSLSSSMLLSGARCLMVKDATNDYFRLLLPDSPADDLKNIVEDTTPQLGGILDANSNQIRWSKGGDIASASPLVLDTDGNYFDVTGTTGFSQITCTAGTFFVLQFDGALTMTDGANLDLGGLDITTAAGDRALFFAIAANTAQLLSYKEEGNRLPSPDFTSSDQTITVDSLLNVAHGLGALPTLVRLALKCTTANAGYAIDDEIQMPGLMEGIDGGLTTFADATNVGVVTATVVTVIDKGTFNSINITTTSWRYVVRAWK